MSQRSTAGSNEKELRNSARASHDTDSIVSSTETQADHDALDRTLTQHTTRASDHMSLSQRVTTIPTNVTADPNYEVDWDGGDDPENPKNWTIKYKAMGLTFLSWNTLIV